ncbi:hypothetical protein ACTFIZ_011330 [Dictyostelium cf. discoideum]
MNLNDEDNYNSAIVIDNGSYLCKAGFGGEESPRAIFRSVVGRPNFCNRGVKNGMGQKDCYVGDEAIVKKSILSLKCPNESKSPVNWDDIEKILQHVFYNELRVSLSSVMNDTESLHKGVLLSEIPLNPKENRERITQIMFETFDTPNFYLANQSVLSLYSKGRINGIVLDSGNNITYTVPIYEGYSIPNSINQLKIAGNSITEYLMKLLNENRGYNFTTSSEKEIVKDIKEKFGFISSNYFNELYSTTTTTTTTTTNHEIEKSYQLPDGQTISIGKERFICAEILFEPSLANIESHGIHQLLYNSIINCDIEIRRGLYNNIILSGGTTMLASFKNRLENELINLSPPSMKIKVIENNTNENNSHLAWIGGSIFSSLSTFEQQSISKQEYMEYGSKIIHRKCF